MSKFLSFALVCAFFTASASVDGQVNDTKSAPLTGSQNELQILLDKQAIRELIDTFAVLADDKNIDEQMKLFTHDAEVTSIEGEQKSTLKGTQNLGKAFSDYLANFHTVYHLNGQQVVQVRGDKASGIYYGVVTLISEENGKDVVMVRNVRYNDEYKKINGKWLIEKRTANFITRDTKIVDKK